MLVEFKRRLAMMVGFRRRLPIHWTDSRGGYQCIGLTVRGVDSRGCYHFMGLTGGVVSNSLDRQLGWLPLHWADSPGGFQLMGLTIGVVSNSLD
jgi:hypothetical protein